MKEDFFTGYIPPTSSERRVSKNKEPFFYEGARLEGLALATLIATLGLVGSITHSQKPVNHGATTPVSQPRK